MGKEQTVVCSFFTRHIKGFSTKSAIIIPTEDGDDDEEITPASSFIMCQGLKSK